MRSGPFKNRKIFKQMLVILIELELIVGVFLCLGVNDAHEFQFNFTHKPFRVFIEEMINIVTKPLAAVGKDYDISEYMWRGPRLSKGRGTIMGPSGKETYYNLNMAGVVRIMRRMGNNDEYWVRSDGVKMLGNYVMVAANLNIRPRGSIVQTSLGPGIVCDTGTFAKRNPTQLDIAVTW